jgi:uncharacterized OB-fold protein
MGREVDTIEVPAKWQVQYNHDIGETASRFFVELRDNARLLATQCPECGRVLFPPRSFCERCFVSLKENWIELKPEGTLEAFTLVTEDYYFPDMPESPYVICLVKFGEASTSIPQILRGVDLSDPKKAVQKLAVGMRVRAVFRDRREGRIEDFHVEPV